MWLEQVSVTNCRIIGQCQLDLAPRANVFIGGNASGKSSLVEALSLLSRGRSWRTVRSQELIRHGEETLTVAGRIADGIIQGSYPIGISRSGRETRIRINHADVHQQSELSSHLPLTIIHPDSVALITGPPAQRRALLDWIAFYRNSEFHPLWKNGQRILRQRNACLRDSAQRYALGYWNEQLARSIPGIHQQRQEALQALQAALQALAFPHPAIDQLRLILGTGFPQGVTLEPDSLLTFFQRHEDQELRAGVSLYGPHRGDLQVLLEGLPAARIASRGELKLLGVALLLAQSQAISPSATKRGIIAIDDLASELDTENQVLLFRVLGQTGQQQIITGTRLPESAFIQGDTRLFHVEQGQFQPR
ncbi:MAG TPA: DNA replication and repair protein RecF [Thiolinea sp.]|nr:DNA replication and repair protein RecF [Thiolinea sp.]